MYNVLFHTGQAHAGNFQTTTTPTSTYYGGQQQYASGLSQPSLVPAYSQNQTVVASSASAVINKGKCAFIDSRIRNTEFF